MLICVIVIWAGVCYHADFCSNPHWSPDSIDLGMACPFSPHNSEKFVKLWETIHTALNCLKGIVQFSDRALFWYREIKKQTNYSLVTSRGEKGIISGLCSNKRTFFFKSVWQLCPTHWHWIGDQTLGSGWNHASQEWDLGPMSLPSTNGLCGLL